MGSVDRNASETTYDLYGAPLISALAFPELSPATALTAGAPVRLHVGEPLDPESMSEWFSCDLSLETAEVVWKLVGRYRLGHGTRVEINPAPDADDGLVRLYFLGFVLSALLQQRDMLVLHASAVAVDGPATFVFMGDKGAGKSTTAATLAGTGAGLLADDMVAISFDDPAGLSIPRGMQHMKLTDEAVRGVLNFAPESLPFVHNSVDKRRLSGLGKDAPAVGWNPHFFVLRRGDTLHLERLSQHDAFTQLVRYSYLPRLSPRCMTGTLGAQHLRQCAAVARERPVSILTVPGSVASLAEQLPGLHALLRGE
jgi:hypothetical protein